jgi:transposase
MNQKRQRKDFTEEFKKDAVSLVTEQGYSCSEVARRLGINHTNVSRWVRHHRDQLESPPQRPESLREIEDEVKRLRKENKRLLMEREILKKAAAFFANESNRDSISSGSK